jgi:ketosteroid isomerase-like protein
MEPETREARNAEFVRRLWAASSRGGTEEALRMLDRDATWRLHIRPDRVLTTEELAGIFRKLERNRRVTAAHLARLEAEQDRVFAGGSFRWMADDGSLIDFHGYWVYDFRDGKLISGQSFASRVEALGAFRGDAVTPTS